MLALPRFLPRRLIALGSKSGSHVHLVETDEISYTHCPPYAALSHCWGKIALLRTTKATLNDWKNEIPYGRLSKTFQDAIDIARMLDIAYLWIDSLCIVQDDTHDWETQAAAMAAIYNSAQIVISATGAADGNTGCLIEKPRHVTMEGPGATDNQQHEIYARECLEHKHFREVQEQYVDEWLERIEAGEFPTFDRAWCSQERLLGRRILQFTKSEVVFECLDSISCECGSLTNFKDDPLLLSRLILNGQSLPGAFNGPSDLVIVEDQVRRKRAGLLLRMTWRENIPIYCYKNLTRQTDLLPALAGLASIWSKHLNDGQSGNAANYLAGNWACDIYASLMWQWRSTEHRKRTEGTYTAPIWSWASAHRPIHFYTPEEENNPPRHFRRYTTTYHSTIDLEKSACVPSCANPFGSVQTGWLHITGHVIRATIPRDTYFAGEGFVVPQLPRGTPSPALSKEFLRSFPGWYGRERS